MIVYKREEKGSSTPPAIDWQNEPSKTTLYSTTRNKDEVQGSNAIARNMALQAKQGHTGQLFCKLFINPSFSN